MDKKISNNFWKEYVNSDELKQRELLQKITGTKLNNQGFFKNMNVTLFKSYIDDALDFRKTNKRKRCKDCGIIYYGLFCPSCNIEITKTFNNNQESEGQLSIKDKIRESINQNKILSTKYKSNLDTDIKSINKYLNKI